MSLLLRQAIPDDLPQLLSLYTHLHHNPMPEIDDRIEQIWQRIMGDSHHIILLGEVESRIVSTCVLIIVENLTHSQRPYGLIENMLTHPDYRQLGYGGSMLHEARRIALQNNCYKLMLLTGSKDKQTLNFYRKAGFNSDDKTGFVQWLE